MTAGVTIRFKVMGVEWDAPMHKVTYSLMLAEIRRKELTDASDINIGTMKGRPSGVIVADGAQIGTFEVIKKEEGS